MKIRILLPALFIFTLSISACQAIEDELPAVLEEEKEMEKKTGAVMADETLGGYFLQSESEKIKIRSLAVDLRKFENRRVEAKGVMGPDDVFTVESVTQMSRDDETKVNLKETTLGISLDYPNVWQAAAKENSYVFTPYKATDSELVDKITASRFENPDKKSLESYLDLDANLKPKDASDLSTYTSVVVGLDQLPGTKKTSEDGVRIDFYVTRDTWVYRLSHSAIDTENREKNRNIFFDIVNSFKFVAFSGETQAPAQIPTEPVPSVLEPTMTPVPTPEPTPAPSVPEPAPEETSTSTFQPTLQEGMQLLSSRGFQISMQYPKSWFWEQVGGEIQFTDKQLSDGGVIQMKLTVGGEEGTTDEAFTRCSVVGERKFCMTGGAASSQLMGQMLNSIISEV